MAAGDAPPKTAPLPCAPTVLRGQDTAIALRQVMRRKPLGDKAAAGKRTVLIDVRGLSSRSRRLAAQPNANGSNQVEKFSLPFLPFSFPSVLTAFHCLTRCAFVSTGAVKSPLLVQVRKKTIFIIFTALPWWFHL